MQQGQVRMKLFGCLVALTGISRTSSNENFIQLRQPRSRQPVHRIKGQGGKGQPIPAGACLVKHFSKAKHIGLWRAWSFGRDITIRPDVCGAGAELPHQADITEFWHAANVENIRRFDVTMDQTVLVQMAERPAQVQAQLDAFLERQAAPAL